jgi:LmbE family N-acetylglucosaminyl deacetylase
MVAAMLPTIVVAYAHQDDEVLSGGGTIVRHRALGHRVVLLPFTDGINSAAREATGLSRNAFAQARDREMHAAVERLGVEVIRPRLLVAEDGKLTAERARDFLDWALSTWPDARLKVPTHLEGGHPDHRAIGLAALRLQQDRAATGLDPLDVRYLVEPERVDSWAQRHPTVRLMRDTPGDPTPLLEALSEYEYVERSAGRYGIGALSVPHLISLVRSRPWSTYHA